MAKANAIAARMMVDSSDMVLLPCFDTASTNSASMQLIWINTGAPDPRGRASSRAVDCLMQVKDIRWWLAQDANV
jgi:hypothetical protein